MRVSMTWLAIRSSGPRSPAHLLELSIALQITDGPITRWPDFRSTVNLDAKSLAALLENFLAETRHAVVMENGAVLFDLRRAHYSLSPDRDKCVLHLWSDERNTVRRVLAAEMKNGVLRLQVLRFGQARPSRLEICPSSDARTPSASKAARSAYEQRLQRVLELKFPGFKVPRLTSAMDLEQSFGPVYARGLLRRGQCAFAVVGVNAQETQASVDGALTCGILWLDACRLSDAAARLQVEGLKLFLPPGTSELTRERMARLNRGAAKWQLYEFDEREEEFRAIDTADRGNIATRLVHCPDLNAARERFADSIRRVHALFGEADVAALSPGEIAFRWHGLEFARARTAFVPGSFRAGEEIVFGVGPAETVLDDSNQRDLVTLVERMKDARRPQGTRANPLWRMHPERWLESLVFGDITAIDERLDPACLYSQVPAFSAADRAMLDVLAATRTGRLAVVELKAEEDIHLPLQGLDYWTRVEWHQARGEFRAMGYFPERELSSEPPLLLLVAPALHVHPATDLLLHYLSPEIEWMLIGIDEHWREGVKVIFRKRPQRAAAA